MRNHNRQVLPQTSFIRIEPITSNFCLEKLTVAILWSRVGIPVTRKMFPVETPFSIPSISAIARSGNFILVFSKEADEAAHEKRTKTRQLSRLSYPELHQSIFHG
jgi:hypothetical protein